MRFYALPLISKCVCAADFSVPYTVFFANNSLPYKLHSCPLHEHLANPLSYFYLQQAQDLSFEHPPSQQTFPVHVEPLHFAHAPSTSNTHILAPSLLPCTYKPPSLHANCLPLAPSTLPAVNKLPHTQPLAHWVPVPSYFLLSPLPAHLQDGLSGTPLFPVGLTFPRTHSAKIPSSESRSLAFQNTSSQPIWVCVSWGGRDEVGEQDGLKSPPHTHNRLTHPSSHSLE